ncbi:MAG: Type II secretion system protein E [Candidatus Omnitrophica bacterium ADurb.Bin292]|jgi:type IV pilus assembly protein PilB|nr:MAG: Type II secretion system protein E [Candidatus Omnitrophica bacterium ADurb.Bin292]HPW77305.1 ATPase, T2SS/T4P/T4SS family [Candidatus Omnitrophota bacterium]HQB12463.1 ATPase, T2SS/T4P/T4SS family [Candidatus Omnitrophota bacterium]
MGETGKESGIDIKDLLVRENIAKREDVEWAEKEILKNPRKQVVDALLEAGRCHEKKLASLMSALYGYRLVSLKMLVIHEDILALIPPKIAEAYSCIPVSILDKTLTVAFANPTNLNAIDEVQIVTGKRVRAAVAEYSVLKECIRKFYFAGQKEDPVSENDKEMDPESDELVCLAKQVREDSSETQQEETADLMAMASQAPVVKLVNMVLLEGIRRKASDIFIEPWENYVRVRIRVDGILEEIVKPQKSFGAAVVSRIKIMSHLNIAEHRVPQDGRFKVRTQGREVDMRVSVLPSSFGEKVCLRILDTGSQAHDISKLGFLEKEQQLIRDCAKKPHGMILVTGPTGSGKTTTLYSILNYLDSPQVNITTVEDPVEYQIPGINQVNVRESIGLTFPVALRSILRQDPDIVLIGEIRDAETLDIAVKAALTGHLVLSTLHTNDSVSSITRMVNLGLEPFLIASTVLMISAQRLVRKLCPRCKYAYDLEPEMYPILGLDPAKKIQLWRAKGCSQCRKMGYQGRSVITEIFEMSPDMLDLIMQGVSADVLKAKARANGMNTLRESAIAKALAGETSIEEVFRVSTEDQELNRSSKGDAHED